MNQKGKRQNFRTCALPHYTGTSTGPDGTTASAYRVLTGKGYGNKYLYSEIHGKPFENADKAFEAIHAKGYGSEYFRRDSTVCATFKELDFMQAAARFDALYRYWKKINNPNCSEIVYLKYLLSPVHLESELRALAKKVSIFHPCTKYFSEDYPIQFKAVTCKGGCGRTVKNVWPYQGKLEYICFECRLKRDDRRNR